MRLRTEDWVEAAKQGRRDALEHPRGDAGGGAAFLLAMSWAVPGFRVSRSRSALWCGAMVALALAADAAIHLECGCVDPAHTVVWHLGAVALLSLLGALAGRLMPRW